MELSNRALSESRAAIQEVMAMKPPALLGYRLSKNMIAIQDALRPFDAAQNELVDRYGKRQPEGMFGVNPRDGERWKKYVQDLNQLLDQVVEVAIDPINLKEMESGGVTPSVGALTALHFMWIV
jgi:hypothetical protein